MYAGLTALISWHHVDDDVGDDDDDDSDDDDDDDDDGRDKFVYTYMVNA